MSESEFYDEILTLAIEMARQKRTIKSIELTSWINKTGFEHPYGNSRGVLQAAFRRAKYTKNQEAMDALVKAFTHNDGTPLWQE